MKWNIQKSYAKSVTPRYGYLSLEVLNVQGVQSSSAAKMERTEYTQ